MVALKHPPANAAKNVSKKCNPICGPGNGENINLTVATKKILDNPVQFILYFYTKC